MRSQPASPALSRARQSAGEAGWDRIVAQVEEVMYATIAEAETPRVADARRRAMAGAA